MRFGGRYEDMQEATDALRDILYLYFETTDYNGIVGDHDTGSFKPWRFLNCSLDDGYGGPEAQQLLHEGSAVALLSEMIDWWTQGSGSGIQTFQAAVDQGRFDHLPTARRAVVAGLDGEQAMIPHLDAVYEEYVLARFARLASARNA
jgi:hypothetical protein